MWIALGNKAADDTSSSGPFSGVPVNLSHLCFKFFIVEIIYLLG